MIKSVSATKAVFAVLIVCGASLSLGAGLHVFNQAAPSSQQPLPATAPPWQLHPTQYTMVQILKLIADSPTTKGMPYSNRERAEALAKSLATPADPGRMNGRISMEKDYADELLNAGQSEKALREYGQVERDEQTYLPRLVDHDRAYFSLQKAIGNLRLGEQQNCCASNNADSCLLPISGKGIHSRQQGSRNCIKLLSELLAQSPDDVKARWLLNIAYMTVGEYPAGVPAKWRISLKTFGDGNAPMPRFYNAAPKLGLDVEDNAGGVAMENFEGKGNLDIMVSCMRPDAQLRYFRNNGDGTFTERTKQAGLMGEIGGLNMVTADYDNDGRPDVLILRGGWYGTGGHMPMSLLHNNGNGTFTDVTMKAGVLHFKPTQTAAWLDFNGDGNLDLFVGNESSQVDSNPCELFRNNGNGTFSDVSHACGVDIVKFVKGVVSADYDHDGRPDVYLSCQGSPNILLHNDGPAGPDRSPQAAWKFTNVAHTAGVDKQNRTFSCFFFDFDNDGWSDLYVGGYGSRDVTDIINDYLGKANGAEKARLYRNNRDGTFSDIAKQAHLFKVIQGMGINFGDLDNDGWLDFYAGTGNPDLATLIPKRMFHNVGGKYFDEVTIAGNFGHLQKGHAIAFGDINNNGQQDVYAKLGGAFTGDTAHACLFVNPGNRNHWITLNLEGVHSNRAALGAEICVTASTPTGERRLYRTVSTGGSFGCNPLRQHVGLGDATAIKSVTIHWPASGITQMVDGLRMDSFYKIREGDSKAALLNLKTFDLPTAPATQMARALTMN